MSQVECPLSVTARAMPDQVAIIDKDLTLTYAQLDRFVDRIACHLKAANVSAGDRVAFQLENMWRTIALLWACFRLQAIVSPISTRLPETSARAVAESVGSRFTIRSSDLDEWSSQPADTTCTRSVNDEALATIFFTSGTTGIPKAVAHTLRSHLRSAAGSNFNLPLTPGDRWWLSLPLYHVGGLGIVFRCVLSGATIVIQSSRANPNDFVNAHDITHVSMVPTQLKRWLDGFGDLSRRPVVLLGGSRLPPDLIARSYERGLRVRTTYGLSEMASQVTATAHDTPPHMRTTAGRVLPFRELTASATGNILVRGETLFQGYFDRNGLNSAVDDEGWLDTRDLGQLDRAGYLTVTGRADNMFISGGENIYPEEIETILLDHPAVRQVIVVPVRDKIFGERPIAFVDAADSAIGPLNAWLADRLPKFKIPTTFFPWPSQIAPLGEKSSRHIFKKLCKLKVMHK